MNGLYLLLTSFLQGCQPLSRFITSRCQLLSNCCCIKIKWRFSRTFFLTLVVLMLSINRDSAEEGFYPERISGTFHPLCVACFYPGKNLVRVRSEPLPLSRWSIDIFLIALLLFPCVVSREKSAPSRSSFLIILRSDRKRRRIENRFVSRSDVAALILEINFIYCIN